MNQKQATATPLFHLAGDAPPRQGGEIATKSNDSSPPALVQSIPSLVEALWAACTTPEQVLGVIGALLPRLEVSPTRRIQALLMLNPSFDRPSYPGLANRVGRCKPYVHNVCTGKLNSPPLRQDVAKALCVQSNDIWPSDPHAPKVEQS